MLRIVKTEGAQTVSLAFKGRLDTSSAIQAEQAVRGSLGAGDKNLILDLTDMDYISSAGLRVLLLANKYLKQKAGDLALCGLQPNVLEVLNISGFTPLFLIAATPDAAKGGKSADVQYFQDVRLQTA